jgi:hypothetical protein
MARVQPDEGKERFWRRVLAQWQASQPTTVRVFCVAQRISQPSFYWWRREIAHSIGSGVPTPLAQNSSQPLRDC